jgi:pimeloyl-ACP methyl ester carboxylesterase
MDGIGSLIIMGVILLIAFCCFGCCINQANWMSKKRRDFNARSDLFQSTFGQVEYAKKGEGPCIVIVHGTPGMHDGLSGFFDDWVKEGFTVITPSRAGYGRSVPLNNYMEQADAIAELLDSLGIKECAVHGTSGGGPTVIQFALRHPGKCRALITEAAVTGNYTHPNMEEMTGSTT